MKRFIKNNLFGFIIGVIITSGIGVYAAYKYNASDISYKDTDVESAINDLYDKIPKLELGKTYQMGGYEWICAELLNGGCVMQSTGMTNGAWPGYKLTSNYEGTKSYGNANTNYTSNIHGDNIANYDNKTSTFYEAWKSVEKTTPYGKGLFLVSKEKCEISANRTFGNGYYADALASAANHEEVRSFSWLGSVTDNAWVTSKEKYSVDISGYYQQTFEFAIAPAFNLDSSKVYLDGTTIKKK